MGNLLSLFATTFHLGLLCLRAMKLTPQVKGIREDKRQKIARHATRPQDMPACALCMRQIMGAAVQGYDGRWRCLACNDVHATEVLHESGDAAPNESENQPGLAAAKTPEATERRRQARAAAILEKYGVTKKGA
jgi:hypothetical protein